MTREDAIKILKPLFEQCKSKNGCLGYIEHFFTKNEEEAFDMAIKALESKDVLDKIIAEIKEWYWQADKQALAKDPCVVDAMIDLFIRTIDKYKAESEE